MLCIGQVWELVLMQINKQFLAAAKTICSYADNHVPGDYSWFCIYCSVV